MDEKNFVLIMAAVLLLILFVSVAALLLRKGRRRTDLFEDMEGHEFEYFCADLLKQKGFVDVEVTKGSGDYGVSILP